MSKQYVDPQSQPIVFKELQVQSYSQLIEALNFNFSRIANSPLFRGRRGLPGEPGTQGASGLRGNRIYFLSVIAWNTCFADFSNLQIKSIDGKSLEESFTIDILNKACAYINDDISNSESSRQSAYEAFKQAIGYVNGVKPANYDELQANLVMPYDWIVLPSGVCAIAMTTNDIINGQIVASDDMLQITFIDSGLKLLTSDTAALQEIISTMIDNVLAGKQLGAIAVYDAMRQSTSDGIDNVVSGDTLNTAALGLQTPYDNGSLNNTEDLSSTNVIATFVRDSIDDDKQSTFVLGKYKSWYDAVNVTMFKAAGDSPAINSESTPDVASMPGAVAFQNNYAAGLLLGKTTNPFGPGNEGFRPLPEPGQSEVPADYRTLKDFANIVRTSKGLILMPNFYKTAIEPDDASANYRHYAGINYANELQNCLILQDKFTDGLVYNDSTGAIDADTYAGPSVIASNVFEICAIEQAAGTDKHYATLTPFVRYEVIKSSKESDATKSLQVVHKAGVVEKYEVDDAKKNGLLILRGKILDVKSIDVDEDLIGRVHIHKIWPATSNENDTLKVAIQLTTAHTDSNPLSLYTSMTMSPIDVRIGSTTQEMLPTADTTIDTMVVIGCAFSITADNQDTIDAVSGILMAEMLLRTSAAIRGVDNPSDTPVDTLDYVELHAMPKNFKMTAMQLKPIKKTWTQADTSQFFEQSLVVQQTFIVKEFMPTRKAYPDAAPDDKNFKKVKANELIIKQDWFGLQSNLPAGIHIDVGTPFIQMVPLMTGDAYDMSNSFAVIDFKYAFFNFLNLNREVAIRIFTAYNTEPTMGLIEPDGMVSYLFAKGDKNTIKLKARYFDEYVQENTSDAGITSSERYDIVQAASTTDTSGKCRLNRLTYTVKIPQPVTYGLSGSRELIKLDIKAFKILYKNAQNASTLPTEKETELNSDIITTDTDSYRFKQVSSESALWVTLEQVNRATAERVYAIGAIVDNVREHYWKIDNVIPTNGSAFSNPAKPGDGGPFDDKEPADKLIMKYLEVQPFVKVSTKLNNPLNQDAALLYEWQYDAESDTYNQPVIQDNKRTLQIMSGKRAGLKVTYKPTNNGVLIPWTSALDIWYDTYYWNCNDAGVNGPALTQDATVNITMTTLFKVTVKFATGIVPPSGNSMSLVVTDSSNNVIQPVKTTTSGSNSNELVQWFPATSDTLKFVAKSDSTNYSGSIEVTGNLASSRQIEIKELKPKAVSLTVMLHLPTAGNMLSDGAVAATTLPYQAAGVIGDYLSINVTKVGGSALTADSFDRDPQGDEYAGARTFTAVYNNLIIGTQLKVAAVFVDPATAGYQNYVYQQNSRDKTITMDSDTSKNVVHLYAVRAMQLVTFEGIPENAAQTGLTRNMWVTWKDPRNNKVATVIQKTTAKSSAISVYNGYEYVGHGEVRPTTFGYNDATTAFRMWSNRGTCQIVCSTNTAVFNVVAYDAATLGSDGKPTASSVLMRSGFTLYITAQLGATPRKIVAGAVSSTEYESDLVIYLLANTTYYVWAEARDKTGWSNAPAANTDPTATPTTGKYYQFTTNSDGSGRLNLAFDNKGGIGVWVIGSTFVVQ